MPHGHGHGRGRGGEGHGPGRGEPGHGPEHDGRGHGPPGRGGPGHGPGHGHGQEHGHGQKHGHGQEHGHGPEHGHGHGHGSGRGGQGRGPGHRGPSCGRGGGDGGATDDTDEGGDILEPQGTHYEQGSQEPLSQAVQWRSAPAAYFNALKEANGGAPVYKAHHGLACIAITDHAGGKWFFNQPETVLDRLDGAAIGPVKLSKDYVGDTVPALVSNMSESHAAVRDYTTDVVRERLGATQTALTHASDKFYKNLRENGLGEYTTVYDTFLQQVGPFVLEWIFRMGEEGGQALPPFKDYLTVNPSDGSMLFKLQIDTMDLPIPEASQAQKDSVDVLLNSILDSKMWPKYAEMLAQNNVPIKSLERTLMFTTGLQSATAMAKGMESALGVLTAHPDFAEDLRKEIDGQELTIESANDVGRFPLLDSLHWEILRMFPAPSFYFKIAKKDLLIPTSTGQRYQVKEGDVLYCHQPLVQIDEARFGSDAREFKPRRFVGNPGLKKDVFAYVFPDHAKPQRVEGMPWGCVAHTVGVLDGIIKVLYGRFVQEATFELTETPVIDPDLYLGTVGPANMAFAKVTLRK